MNFRALALGGLAILAACSDEPVLMEPPGLDGPITKGEWEQRQRDGLTFWPPSREGTRLPEIIDVSCVDKRRAVRVTVTGDLDQTGLWIAGEGTSSRTLLLETEHGVTAIDFTAGDNLLPSIVVQPEEDWLQPLLAGEGRFAINAYGGRIYRMHVSPKIAETVAYCARRKAT